MSNSSSQEGQPGESADSDGDGRRVSHDEEKRLSVLGEFAESAPIDGDVEILVVFHLMQDTHRFIGHLVGTFDIERVIGVPDGTNLDAASAIGESYGVEVTVPETVAEVEEQSRQYVEEFVATRNPDEHLILLDVGGHCASFIEDVATEGVLGIVEDTNQGHWKYKRLEDLPVPVYSIAQAPVKMPENRLVGHAVTFSVENIVRNVMKQELNGRRVLILGFGNIGESAADACRGRGADVMVYDTDPLKNIAARLEGYTVEDRETMLRKADVVIGVSGTTSVSKDDFSRLSDGAVLASGSSHQVEFDVDGLREIGTVTDQTDVSTTYEVDGSRVILLNDGWPVNFLDSSISNSTIDLIYSGLFVCLCQLAESASSDSALPAGMYEPDEERIADVARRWLEVY